MKNSRNNNIIFGFSVWFYVFGFSYSNGLIIIYGSDMVHCSGQNQSKAKASSFSPLHYRKRKSKFLSHKQGRRVCNG